MPYRLYIDKRRGLLVYIRPNLPSRYLTNFTTPKDIQITPPELNLRIEKWILTCIYRPAQNKQCFLENLSMIVDNFPLFMTTA